MHSDNEEKSKKQKFIDLWRAVGDTEEKMLNDAAAQLVWSCSSDEIQDELDRLLPPWQPAFRLENVDGVDREAFLTDADDDAENGIREVVFGDDVHVMPFQNYARGIDGAGNMCPVSIATQRRHPTDREMKHGQNTGYDQKVLNDYPILGWLFVDHPRFDLKTQWQDKIKKNDERGRLDMWRRLCLIEMFRRRKAKQLREQREADQFLTKQEQLVRNFRTHDAEQTRSMMKDLINGFGDKLAEAVASREPDRKAKGKTAE